MSGPHPDPHSFHVPPVFWQSVILVSSSVMVLFVDRRTVVVITMSIPMMRSMVGIFFILLNCILVYLNVRFFGKETF